MGYGIGRDLYEVFEVFNYGKRGCGFKLKEGLVIVIEFMVNLGRKEVWMVKDGWMVIVKDLKFLVYYEYIVVVKDGEVDILLDYSGVEVVIL